MRAPEPGQSEERPTGFGPWAGYQWCLRLFWWVGMPGIVMFCAVLAVTGWKETRARTAVEARLEALDREEPGWRFEEILAAREVIPDEENSALVIEKGRRLIPKEMADRITAGRISNRDAGSWMDAAFDATRNRHIDPETLQEMRAGMKELEPALEVLRPIQEMPLGRYPLSHNLEAVYEGSQHVRDLRLVADVLRLDAILFAEEGEIDAALGRCRAIVNAGRSIGTEPVVISQIVRIAVEGIGVVSLEWTLGRGEASDKALAETQALLERDLRDPILEVGIRGERGYIREILVQMADGRLNPSALVDPNAEPGILSKVSHFLAMPMIREAEIYAFDALERLVACAQMPFPEARDEAEQYLLEQTQGRSSSPWDAKGPALSLVNASSLSYFTFCQRRQAELAAAILALAAERYRRDRGDWPESADDLVPDFLDTVPDDPYTGEPLTCERVPGGFRVWSIGMDRVDNGGYEKPRPFRSGVGFRDGEDMVFELLDPENRGLPYEPENPAESGSVSDPESK